MKHKCFKNIITHEAAILHLIGQADVVFRDKASIADIASWMQLSKVSALKHVKRLASQGKVVMTQVPYRQHFRWQVGLSKSYQQKYNRGELKEMYKVYAQKVLKVTLQDD